jgi:hypothetical protein
MAAPDRKPEPSAVPQPEAEPVFVQDEIDSTKWSMPPWGVVGIVLLVIFIGVGIVSYLMRPKPKATGSIDDVFAVAMSGNSVMCTMKVTLHNIGGKPLWIQDIKAALNTDQGQFTDTAANAVDFPRYFEAFPDLREHTITPMKVEDRIAPGEQERGSVMATFPVSIDQFNARKSISVTIKPYDQNPVTITNPITTTK